MTKYNASAHCVGESNWHLQFTPGYRRPIFDDNLTRELTVAYLVEAANELHIHVGAIECGQRERTHHQGTSKTLDEAREAENTVQLFPLTPRASARV